jgi:hypothetical protein
MYLTTNKLPLKIRQRQTRQQPTTTLSSFGVPFFDKSNDHVSPENFCTTKSRAPRLTTAQ